MGSPHCSLAILNHLLSFQRTFWWHLGWRCPCRGHLRWSTSNFTRWLFFALLWWETSDMTKGGQSSKVCCTWSTLGQAAWNSHRLKSEDFQNTPQSSASFTLLCSTGTEGQTAQILGHLWPAMAPGRAGFKYSTGCERDSAGPNSHNLKLYLCARACPAAC